MMQFKLSDAASTSFKAETEYGVASFNVPGNPPTDGDPKGWSKLCDQADKAKFQCNTDVPSALKDDKGKTGVTRENSRKVARQLAAHFQSLVPQDEPTGERGGVDAGLERAKELANS